MTTDLTTYQPSTPSTVVADYQTRAVQRLGEWAASADAAFRVAQRLVETSFVPQQFRGKPVEATAAILAGSEVGLQPMAALKSFDVIQGTAAPRAITLRAIVQSYGHEMVLVESTNTRCKMKGLRRGSSEWQTVTWTIDRAKDLGLTGKDNWRKQPAAMLMARATSELARLIAADAILGIGYTAEEVADGAQGDVPMAVEADPEAAPAAAPGRRTLSRPRPAPGAEPLGTVEPEPEPEADVTEPAATPDPITAPQLKKMGALMREAGLTDRASALAFVTETIGRDVESRNDLTKREAGQVIDALEAVTPATVPAEPEGWDLP